MPIVMNTQEQLRQAFGELERARFLSQRRKSRTGFSLSGFDFLDVHIKPNRLKPVLLGLQRPRCFGTTRAGCLRVQGFRLANCAGNLPS